MKTSKNMSAHSLKGLPRYVRPGGWSGYLNPLWHKKQKKDVTVLFSFVERWKSFFLKAYFLRKGFKVRDLGDHVAEDVRWGKMYGNRMECNPMYFTSGALIRNLFKIEKETGYTKDEIVQKYVFLGGGGQCGPCRYGMYPQEYMKAADSAGFKGFRILIFGSDLMQAVPKESAFRLNLPFRVNLLVSIILGDFLHLAECALRPKAISSADFEKSLKDAETVLYKAFESPFWLLKLPFALIKAGNILSRVKTHNIVLPKIYITGEFFANHAHNDGNYNLRRFIMDDGCYPMPALFTQRSRYDNWRRTQEARRGIRFGQNRKEYAFYKKMLKRQKISDGFIRFFYNFYLLFFRPKRFTSDYKLPDLDHLAEIGKDYYHPEIFGGEGHLEIAEAIHYADHCDGFISCKPFGCMPSSGVSDGVMSKITTRYPQLNFLSIETSGDNEVSILGRVSMLLFKAKQSLNARKRH